MFDVNFEDTILKHILFDERYFGIVYPHLKTQHFSSVENVEIFKLIQEFVKKYDKHPSPKEFLLFFKNNNKINENLKEKIKEKLTFIVKDDAIQNEEFLIKETNKYIQKVELTNAILQSAEILEKDRPFEEIVGLIESAISVNLDTDTGMSFNNSAEYRYEYYTKKMMGIPMGISSVDKALGSGFRSKTLNLFAAPSHGGKSALLISAAANFLLRKKDVLFVPLEMTEEETARRIDSNLLGVPTNDLGKISKDEFVNKISKLNLGRLFIKEYPAGTFNTIKLKALLKELETQENFNPEIVIIDYIGIMSSSRASLSQAGGTYQYFKLIAEELHGFAKEYDKIILTAAQLNRSAYGSLDAGLDTIADSLGVIQTADTVMAILSTDELRSENKAVIKFLKNRYTGMLSSHMINVDFNTMRFYDLDESADELNKMNEIASKIGVEEVDAMVQQIATASVNTGMINFN